MNILSYWYILLIDPLKLEDLIRNGFLGLYTMTTSPVDDTRCNGVDVTTG